MLLNTNKFSKTTKFHEPVGRVLYVVWKIYKCAYLHQIAPKSMSLLVSLVDNLHEKRTTESQDIRNFDSARAICNFHSCYNFAPMLYEKCNCFEPNRRAQLLFRYIIKPQI